MNTNDSEHDKRTKFAEAIAELGDSVLGMGGSMLLIFLGFGLMWAIPGIAVRWDGHLYDPRGCVELKELHGELFKLDTCNGKVERLETPTVEVSIKKKDEPGKELNGEKKG